MPNYIIGCIGGAMASISTLAVMSFKCLFGQIPNPVDVNAWPFYGVLIVAIVALSLFILSLLRWCQTKALEVIEKNATAMNNVSTSLGKVHESLEKQSEFFENLGVEMIRHSLSEAKDKKTH
jgi:hypothetical protein